MADDRWPRDLWLDALWEAEHLRPNERLVAHVFARYAGRETTTWCSWDELRRRTGLRSRDAIWRALQGLLTAGWLAGVSPPRQHSSAVYRMTGPAGSGFSAGPDVRLTDVSEVRETDVCDSSSPSNGTQTSGKLRSDVRLTDPIRQKDLSDKKKNLAGARAAPARCRSGPVTGESPVTGDGRPWCLRCNLNTRMDIDEHDRSVPCPRCHPEAA